MANARSASRLLSILVIGLAASSPAMAFEDVQIEQVIGGVDGNTAIQAIQLRMQGAFENLLAPARLVVRDGNGVNPVVLFDFTQAAVNQGQGVRMLIATSNLPAHTLPALTPDYVLSNTIPPPYLVAGTLTYETDIGVVLWRLSWGGAGYHGPGNGALNNDADGNFNPPFGGPCPASSTSALQFKFSATTDSTSNVQDYAVTGGPATFVNNSGESGTIVSQPMFGACCHDAGCSVVTRSACLGASGNFRGEGTTCDTVQCAPPPSNDLCGNALPLALGITAFSSIGASTDGLPEPSCSFPFFDDQVGSDVWYKFVASCDATASISLCVNTNYDSKIAVYRGASCNTQPPTVCDDDACGGLGSGSPSRVTFPILQGETYLVRIGGYLNAQGNGAIDFHTSNCDPTPPPPITPACCDMTQVHNGDWDGDCDLDLRDFGAFQICAGRHANGATGTCLSDGCSFMDLNADGRVGLDDYHQYSIAQHGVNVHLAGCDANAGSCDAWATGENSLAPFGGTYYVFGSPANPPPGYSPGTNPPIPAGFFGPTSKPFDGVILLGGQPLDAINMASTDTVIEHPPLRFGFGNLPLCDIVPARISALSLRSREPIVVMNSANQNDCNGNGIGDAQDISVGGSADQNLNGIPDECEWYVGAELSQAPPPDGEITACKTHSNGGSYDATIFVQPVFVFVNKADLDAGTPPDADNIRALDSAAAGLPPITFHFENQPFSICPPDTGTYRTPCSEGNFVPGVDTSLSATSGTTATTCASHVQPGESHYICPPECLVRECTYNKTGAAGGRCLPQSCGTPLCGNFPDKLLPGPECGGPDSALCPQIGYFLLDFGGCPGACGLPLGMCVQFYGGSGAGAVQCTRTSDLLCP